MDPVLLSSARHDWQTPDVVLHLVRQLGPIGVDPCTTAANPVQALHWLHEGGLEADWLALSKRYGPTFANPPYGRELPPWVAKCATEGERGAEVVMLVPHRPDTGWFDLAIRSANAICEWKGRLRFKGAEHSEPFPSALLYWGPRPWLFCHVFARQGRVRVLRERNE